MRPALRAHAVSQRGLVTRAQCEAAGYSPTELRALVASYGPWVVVRRGVYVERWRWDGATSDERGRLRDLAAHLMMVEPHVMSHDSAARALGIPMLRPEQDLTHVTRLGVGGSRTEHGVKHHLTRIDLGEVRDAHGLSVTGPARTALDMAREHGREMGVVALDFVRHHGTPLRELERELQVMWSWPGVRTVRQALELSDGRAETAAESLGRLLLVDLGFEDIDVGWPVAVDGRVFWVDLRVGCHLVEVDGLQKLLPRAQGGLAESTRGALRALRARETGICGEGLGMSRLVWDDFFGRARGRAMRRVAAEEQVTRARFGDRLPVHLAEQAARIRRTSPRRSG